MITKTRRLVRPALLTAAGVLLLGVVLSIARLPAHAATTTITVTGTGDTASPPLCTTTCATLRGAVNAANALTTNSTNDVVIVLPSGTINLTAGELDLASGTNTFMTIKGPTAGNPAAAVVNQQTAGWGAFVVALGANITTNFKDLTITGGTANDANTFGGGAILSGDTGDLLTLDDCVITANSSSASAGGGGVLMSPGGSMTITNSTISNNSASQGFAGGVGIANDGGHGASVLTISGSTISGNSATDGAAVAPFGGGVFFDGGGDAGSSLSITRTAFSNNTAGTAASVAGRGGAIYANAPGSITLSAFTGNQVFNAGSNGRGGALWHDTGALTVSTSRIAGNTGTVGSGLYQDTNAGSITADNDWWGANAGPGGAVAGGTLPVTPSTPHWLQLRHIPTSPGLHPLTSTTLTADLLRRNDASVLPGGSLNGLPTFTATFGNAVHGSLANATQFVNGVATATVAAGTTLGAASADVTADSETATASLTIKDDTTTTVGADHNPSVPGQGVQFRATVTAQTGGTTPSTPQGGTVQFQDEGGNLGAAVAVVNGVATTPSIGNLAAGTHTVTATYSGDADFNPSAGTQSGGQTVAKANTSVAVASSPNPSVAAQSVTFSATVTVTAPGTGTPTGTVQFRDGGTPIGSAQTLDGSGVASVSTSSLAVGTHTITADYGGSGTLNPSTGTLSGGQVVAKADTTTIAGSAPNPSSAGNPVDFTATVTATPPGAGTPTGQVQFFVDGSSFGSAAGLDGSGVATLGAVTSLAVGTHPVTATYLGDAAFKPSTSPAASQVVSGFATTTTVVSAANPSVVGEPVTFTATVDSGGNGTPDGTIQFAVDGSSTGSPVALSGGAATSAPISSLTAGNHMVTATYGGGTGFGPSTGTLTGGQTVDRADTATGVVSSASPSVFGQPVTFTATVAGVAPGAGTPTGQVEFFADGSSLATATLSGGAAVSAAIANLAVGSHAVTATYAGDASFTGVGPGSLAGGQMVDEAATTSVVGSSANPTVTGQGTAFTATVTAVPPGAGTPTGSVAFFRDGAPLQTVALSAGSATAAAVTDLAVGTHAVTATYAGDGSFGASTSATLSQVVGAAGTTTTVVTATSPSVFGQPVTFTATVAAVAPATGTATGQVAFFADGSSFATATLSGGAAVSAAIGNLAAGTHTVTATYGGDASFAASTGSTSQVVGQAGVTLTVTAAPHPSVFGQPVTFTVTVTALGPGAGVPTGSVAFLADATPLGAPVALSGGVASLAAATLAPGDHIITATYAGDPSFLSAGMTTSQHVDPAGTATTVATSVNPSGSGQPVTFTATVAPVAPGAGTPAGQAQFFVDGSAFGSPVSLTAGAAVSGPTSSLAAGTHPVTATYAGDGNFNGGTSPVLNQVVVRISATGAVTSTVHPSAFGQPVTFTATFTGTQGTPAGSAQFGVDGANFGSPVTLTAGMATSTATSSLAAGLHNVTATYSGDAVYQAGQYGFAQLVNHADTITHVTSTANPSEFGQSVTFTATLAAVPPGAGTVSGAVQFVVDGSNLGSPVTLTAGVALSSAVSMLGVGPHTVVASYPGDASFNPSSGSLVPVGQVVQKSDSSTAVSSSQNPSAFGQAVQFTAQVSAAGTGAGTPDGTVQFVVDGTSFGAPVTLSGGAATSGSTASLAVGNHMVRADYNASANFNASSGPLAGGQAVTHASSATTVASSRNPSVAGDGVDFTATVAAVAPGAGEPDGTVQFVIDGVDAGSPVTLAGAVATYTTGALGVGNHTVAASYGGSTGFDPSSGTLPGGQTVASPAMADLSIAAFGPSRAVVGLPTVEVIGVTNNGPSNATGVVVDGALPAGWTVLGEVATQGSCSVALPGVRCSIGNMAAGAQVGITLVVVPHAPGTASTTASVTGDQGDPDPHNNSASVTTRVRRFGYWLFGADGGVFSFGDAGFFGSTSDMRLNRPVVAMTSTPSGSGYWLFGGDGGVFSFGDAGFFGSTASMKINAPIVALASTPTGGGYWLFGSDGGVFAFGDAGFYGSTGDRHLSAPIAGMAATPSGHGYWLVGSDGAVYPFGDAGFSGSLADQHLDAPIVDVAPTPTGKGYWLAGSDGAVYPFGDASAFGSLAGSHLNSPITSIAATADGQGYWLVAADGGVFSFGGAPFLGSLGGQHLNKPISGIVSNG